MTSTIEQTAAAIVALINSRPTSPSAAEIAALLVGMVAASPAASMSPEHAALYPRWRGLIEENVREFGGSAEHLTDAEIEAEEERLATHMDIVAEVGERILETPVRTWGDVLAYAEVCFWRHWSGIDPHDPDAEAQMQAGPFSQGELCDEALAKMLGAIFTLVRPAPASMDGGAS